MASAMVTLTPAQAAQIEALVAQGHFASAEDALSCSIGLLVEAASAPRYTPEQIAHLQQGLEQAQRGEFVPQEEVEAFFDSWQAEVDA